MSVSESKLATDTNIDDANGNRDWPLSAIAVVVSTACLCVFVQFLGHTSSQSARTHKIHSYRLYNNSKSKEQPTRDNV